MDDLIHSLGREDDDLIHSLGREDDLIHSSGREGDRIHSSRMEGNDLIHSSGTDDDFIHSSGTEDDLIHSLGMWQEVAFVIHSKNTVGARGGKTSNTKLWKVSLWVRTPHMQQLPPFHTHPAEPYSLWCVTRHVSTNWIDFPLSYLRTDSFEGNRLKINSQEMG